MAYRHLCHWHSQGHSAFDAAKLACPGACSETHRQQFLCIPSTTFNETANQYIYIKESRNRPGVAQRVPGGLGSQISWHSACEGCEVSVTHRPPLPPGMFLVLIFTRGWVDPRAMVWSEGNMSLKNPVTPPGIDAGTVRLVVQHLNHYTTPGPNQYIYIYQH